MSKQNDTVTELNIVQEDVQNLKTQTKLTCKRIETPADKSNLSKTFKKSSELSFLSLDIQRF